MQERARRSRLQFSVWGLLVLILSASTGMSWLATRMNAARRQRDAVVAIREQGGWVTYVPDEPSAPDWACEILGDDFFMDVVEVHSPFCGVGSTGARCLKDLPRIKVLWFTGEQTRDSDLEHLKGLTELERLSIGGSQITDGGLEHLKELDTTLEFLSISDSRITDAGLEQLSKLKRLGTLSISTSSVTDAGLKHLAGLTNLEWLSLDSPRITDAGLEHLEGLANLHSLSLSNTRVTDAGLDHLTGLSKLKRLVLYRSEVSVQGVAELKRALPDCGIITLSP